ncbi:MAG: C39 family peptidase [Bdellovibrionota bacterium]|jgi:hypothetical protein
MDRTKNFQINTHVVKTYLSGSSATLQSLYLFMQESQFELLPDPDLKDFALSFTIPSSASDGTITHLVPCLSLIGEGDYNYCVTLEGRKGESISRATLTVIGRGATELYTPPDIGTGIVAEIDTFILSTKFDSLVLTFHVDTSILMAAQYWLSSITCKYEHLKREPLQVIDDHFQITFPLFSQRDVPEIGLRICSPTSTAMVLNYYKKQCTPKEVADLAYCCDLYGVWPANIYAASRYGILGMLLFFDTWQGALTILQQGIPLILSIRYGKGELTNCAIEREDKNPLGHLVVLCGYEGEYLLVADPAAQNVTSVVRRYHTSELLKIWLERAALAYLLWNPAEKVPDLKKQL